MEDGANVSLMGSRATGFEAALIGAECEAPVPLCATTLTVIVVAKRMPAQVRGYTLCCSVVDFIFSECLFVMVCFCVQFWHSWRGCLRPGAGKPGFDPDVFIDASGYG